MYSSPFGSIFGQDDSAPKAAPPKAVTKPAPKKQSAKIMREMQERMESVEKEEVYKPGQTKGKDSDKKKLFDNTLPQFRAEVEVESKNPEVRNEQAKFALEKMQTKYAAVKRKLAELKRKHASARLYNDMLVQYTQLDPQHKQDITGWLNQNIDAVKQLASARKLKKLTKDTKEAARATDLEIKHLEKLSEIKDTGVNVTGGRTLKSFRTKGMKKIQDSSISADTGPLPKLGGKVSLKDIVRLGNRGVSEIQGYGEDVDEFASQTERPSKKIPKKEKDVVLTRKLAKQLHKKDSFKELFAKGLKGKRYYMNQRKSRGKVERLEHGTELALLDRMQIKWKLEKLETRVNKELSAYKDTQKSIKGLISKVKNSGVEGGKVTTVIGILSEARPEKFVASATLLDALKNSFKQLSQLGYFGQEAKTPSQEAKTLLATSAKESEDAIRELESRQNAAAKLKAKVEDKPAPAPVRTPTPVIIIQIKQELEQQEQAQQKKEDTIKKAGTIFPLLIGGLILYKILVGN